MLTFRTVWGRTSVFLAISTLVVLSTGCGGGHIPDPVKMQRGYVYYLDGAGGGRIMNWGGGVRDGLKNAGYDGEGEMFSWETGLGVLADQTAGNAYKRDKARQLAGKMIEYRQNYPNAPMTLIGLSAGTAMAAFTLEELPAEVKVENVILLSGSLSATYNLTSALRHVNGKMYISTSDRDSVLGGLLPLAGTADRNSGTNATIGVEGPQLPPGASQETRNLYAMKVHVIPWKQEFARYGNRGGHTDTVTAAFVSHYVAPLVKTLSGAQFASAGPYEAGTVKNPGYDRWTRFEPGSWVMLEGTQTINGVTRPFRMKTTLVSKSAGQVVFHREEIATAGQTGPAPFTQTLYESAHIAPAENPLTHPSAQIKTLPDETVRVGSRSFVCAGRSVSVPADFEAWGDKPQTTVYTNPEIPCGIARINITTRFGEKVVNVTGQVTGFHIAGK
jgi:hypothetical protein